jgi:cytochrome c oxidase cbb3-type subunit 1
MMLAGWREGFDPAFTIVPGPARSAIYLLRIVVGALMLAASLEWLLSASALLGAFTRVSVPMTLTKEKTA